MRAVHQVGKRSDISVWIFLVEGEAENVLVLEGLGHEHQRAGLGRAGEGGDHEIGGCVAGSVTIATCSEVGVKAITWVPPCSSAQRGLAKKPVTSSGVLNSSMYAAPVSVCNKMKSLPPWPEQLGVKITSVARDLPRLG